ncbi:cysteine proteinase inhibitor 5-like [Phragmites australis]|uniref:cysteine proteinase inhibitor 5-like n=1 Tax=Phragmites australis TaxID=29695 RepID=UPI002D767B60|nr:cysteine proteinase inhibitor 5-like [Phragmites australis]
MRSLAAVVVVPLVVVVALAVVSVPIASSTVAGVAPTSAPWVTITNIGDPLYQQVANFALLIHTFVFKEKLSLVQVVSGSVQAIGVGNNYSLLLRAANGTGSVGRYLTEVWGVPGSTERTWKVLSFERVAGN